MSPPPRSLPNPLGMNLFMCVLGYLVYILKKSWLHTFCSWRALDGGDKFYLLFFFFLSPVLGTVPDT